MEKIAVVLGNGFYLDAGLQTGYSDFMRSAEFDIIFNSSKLRHYNEKQSVLNYLKNQFESSNWFDMEMAIHDYVKENPDEIPDGQLVEDEFKELKSALCSYLNRIISCGDIQHRTPTNFISALRDSVYEILEINFNYFDPLKIYPELRRINPRRYSSTFVHGNIDNNNIVLGCDLLPGEKVNRQLSFMYKYNMLKEVNHITQNLLDARKLIFYGHSINEMDFCYFRKFFEKVTMASGDRGLYVIIITYDENSERVIKDNIRNQGISVTDLYNNLSLFEFIHTKGINESDTKEIDKMKSMLRGLEIYV